MTTSYGGETPTSLTPEAILTCQAPAGTDSTTPVEVGDIFAILGGTDQAGDGYLLEAATAADAPSTVFLGVAQARTESATADVPVLVLGGAHRITRLLYRAATGTPTVGQSIQIDATDVRKVAGKAYAAGDGLILKVLTDTTEVEVLI